MKSKYLILIIVGIVLFSGCAKEEKPVEEITKDEIQPIAEPKQIEEDTEQIPELQEETIEPPDLTQLTSLNYAIDPDWSPDGSQIVFCLVEGQTTTLYLINADGNGLTKISPGFDPSWSPVEDKLAYELNKQIYTINSNGENIIQLTTEYINAQPAWNPDGTKIAYAHYRAGKPSIWIMNADGSKKTQLTMSTDGECTFPSFSYDGSKIVYTKGPIWDPSSERLPKAPNEIWVMNSDGSNKHRIHAPGDSYLWIFQRAWNKDNNILFAKSPLQERDIPEIGLINFDGSNLRYILTPPKNSLGIPECFYIDPVWDNSGTKIAVTKKIIDGPTNIATVFWKE